jgi:chromosome segregation ATPase
VADRQRELTRATDEAAGLRSRVDDLTSREAELRTALTTTQTRLDETNAQLARTESAAGETTTKLATAERETTRLRDTTAALREVLLTPDLAAEDLRTRLLAELLADRSS